MVEPYVLVGTPPGAWCMDQCLSTSRVENRLLRSTLVSCYSANWLLIPNLMYSLSVGHCGKHPKKRRLEGEVQCSCGLWRYFRLPVLWPLNRVKWCL